MSILNVGVINATDGAVLPSYSTANLPSIASQGDFAYDLTENTVKVFDGINWKKLSSGSPASATGGTILDADGFRYHTFSSVGTLIVTSPGYVDVLLVAGGGGGGRRHGGGGGAGEVLLRCGVYLKTGSYTASVGGGGTGATSNSAWGTRGGTTTFHLFSTLGGGSGFVDGGTDNNVVRYGGSAGGGEHNRGGDRYNNKAWGGMQYGGFGHNGGPAQGSGDPYGGSGGGGAGGDGEIGVYDNGKLNGTGRGGQGIYMGQFPYWGTNSTNGTTGNRGWFGGGGGSGNYRALNLVDQNYDQRGGRGGGGNGNYCTDQFTITTNVTPGQANTGGGGGGDGCDGENGATGGSGIVIVRYLI